MPAEAAGRRAPNTVLLPHLGYVTDGTYRTMYQQIIENICAWQSGAPIRYCDSGDRADYGPSILCRAGTAAPAAPRAASKVAAHVPVSR